MALAPLPTEILEVASVCELVDGDWVSRYCIGDLHQSLYPASIAKVFIAAEVLRQIEAGILLLSDIVKITQNNVANTDLSDFPFDSRPLLNSADEITIEYALDLMLSRSDDTASNQLIDLVTREAVNEYTVSNLGMQGSEITRKYCSRDREDDQYKKALITMCLPRHIEIFFQRLRQGKIHSPFVSEKLSKYMQKETGSDNLSFLHEKHLCIYKGGYLKSTIYDGRACVWRHYALTVEVNGKTFSIILFSIVKSEFENVAMIEGRLRDIFRKYVLLSK